MPTDWDTVQTAGEHAKDLGLPVAMQTCPHCDVTGMCQEIADDADDPDAATPYECGACATEFVV